MYSCPESFMGRISPANVVPAEFSSSQIKVKVQKARCTDSPVIFYELLGERGARCQRHPTVAKSSAQVFVPAVWFDLGQDLPPTV